jgi:hypothetical protein
MLLAVRKIALRLFLHRNISNEHPRTENVRETVLVWKLSTEPSDSTSLVLLILERVMYCVQCGRCMKQPTHSKIGAY